MILDRIVAHKLEEVAAARHATPIEDVRARAAEAPPARDFRGALLAGRAVALIAELKRSSPSAGLIREDFDPAAIAACYREAGAAALSVLTDARYFGGNLAFLAEARDAAPVPALRKDFIVDEYQIYEARAAGADAVLLIVRVLRDDQLAALLSLAGELGMGALVETHSREEVARAVEVGAPIIGINNRDLDTLATDLRTTQQLAGEVPADRVLVSESGIASRRDVESLADAGVHAVLVGQTLMQSADITAAARQLVGVPRRSRPDRGPA